MCQCETGLLPLTGPGPLQVYGVIEPQVSLLNRTNSQQSNLGSGLTKGKKKSQENTLNDNSETCLWLRDLDLRVPGELTGCRSNTDCLINA